MPDKKAKSPAAAEKPADKEKAAAVLQAASRRRAEKVAEAAPTGPLLALHDAFSRGELLTALRLAYSSDSITLDELKSLLCVKGGVGLSEASASVISEQVYSAYGSTFTIEQLVCLLVPVKRVATFAELSESEVALLRTKFAGLQSQEGTIDSSQLKRVAAELPSLHDGPLSADDEAAISAELQANGGSADLQTTFNLFRAAQTRARVPPTSQQMVKAFLAFDTGKSGSAGTLNVEKLKGVVKLFDGPTLKPEVLKNAKTVVDGGAGDVSAKELAAAQKASHDVDVLAVVEGYAEWAKKEEAKKELKAKSTPTKSTDKDGEKGRGFFAFLHRGEPKAEKKAAAASKEVEPEPTGSADGSVTASGSEPVAAEVVAPAAAEPGWFGGMFGRKEGKEAAPAAAPVSAAPVEVKSVQLL